MMGGSVFGEIKRKERREGQSGHFICMYKLESNMKSGKSCTAQPNVRRW